MTPSTFAELRTHQIAARMGARFHHHRGAQEMKRKEDPRRDLVAEIHALNREQMQHPERAASIRARRAVLRDLLAQQRDAEYQEEVRYAQAMPEVCNYEPWMKDFHPHRRNFTPERARGLALPLVLIVLSVAGLTMLALKFFEVL